VTASDLSDTGGVLWAGWRDPGRTTAGSVGLWVFMGVASTLFALFLTAYVMRMAEPDWSPIALPWQLVLSTALLAIGGVVLQRAAGAARAAQWPRARGLLVAGGVGAFAFLAVQFWAWQTLVAQSVVLSGNPSASFFYLLTTMHGLHVLGGVLAWALTTYASVHPRDPVRCAAHIALCARYWHFLLAVWLVLYAAMAWLTPEMARVICGRA
jgi:cytochrome c oxidase subunit 3